MGGMGSLAGSGIQAYGTYKGLGLVAAARWLADNNLGTAGVNVNFKTAGQQRRLPLQLETTLFRVIQEAVTNIVRHAHAKNVNISLRFKKRSANQKMDTQKEIGADYRKFITS